MDKIEYLKNGMIQHGSYNNRIYLLKLTSQPSEQYPHELIDLAEKNNYTKIFAKIPLSDAKSFVHAGFSEEARVPAFFSGKETALFMGFFLNAERQIESNIDEIENVMNLVKSKKNMGTLSNLDNRFILRKCNKADVQNMAKIYTLVFPSYPFPIQDPAYLKEMMKSHVDYYGVETNGHLISLSSAEKDTDNSNVELTDFATLPEWRGNGFAQHLLAKMEKDMKKIDMKTAYTIARAVSPGMNITFSKAGYIFAGRLKNNTNISGKIESMNIWYKSL